MKFAILAVALLIPSAAWAIGYADWTEVPLVWPDPPPPDPQVWYDYIAEGHRHFDLLTVTDADDRWNAGTSHAYFEGEASGAYSFWDHPLGGQLPNTVLFPYVPLLVYDSFWTSPEEFPNPDLIPSRNDTWFVPGGPTQDSATDKAAEWYVDPTSPNVFGGTSVLARYNVKGLCPDGYSGTETTFGPAAELIIDGGFWYAGGGDGGEWFELRIPLCWYVPEPSTLALLAIGALLIRRR